MNSLSIRTKERQYLSKTPRLSEHEGDDRTHLLGLPMRTSMLVCHWTGEHWGQETLVKFQQHCASKSAPAVSTAIKQRLRHEHPDEEEQYEKEWKRMWGILCSISITCL
ncbi:Hypothetical protein PHPALM_18846 [Phytophthora palmivora]|uniref:Uncharacterized protein n=1 Tax=Phytophthora palmivora TaxID=4796 RepID=A0A2P4XIY8_9STRA|nr:Hypothetical protein PHPALM_18846 [Phytophthora palmivora]